MLYYKLCSKNKLLQGNSIEEPPLSDYMFTIDIIIIKAQCNKKVKSYFAEQMT